MPTNHIFVGNLSFPLFCSSLGSSSLLSATTSKFNLDKKAVPFEAKGNNKKISATRLEELMQKAQKEYDITDRNLRRIKKLDEYMINNSSS